MDDGVVTRRQIADAGSTTWSLGVRLAACVEQGTKANAIFGPILDQMSVAKLGYALLLRVLTAVGGAIAAYGATGMFTTGGITPPNAIVIVGLAAAAAAALALWSSERTRTGVWTALLIAAVPFSLYAIGSWGTNEWSEAHPPITQSYSCGPVGTHAIAIIGPAVTLVGLATLALDIRKLTGGRGGPPKGS